MKDEIIINVDENDNEIGFIEKLDAHIKGVLHRAISVFIFNDNKELLLQKRFSGKYHSPGLWTNTCCTHPNKNEDTGSIKFNPIEVEDYKWISLDKLKTDLKENPEKYTFWFAYIMNNHFDDLKIALNSL